MSDHQAPWGLMACYAEAEALVDAARVFHQAGYRRIDGHTPFPVDGLDEALGHRRGTWVPLIVLVGAIAGGAFGYWIQWWTAVVDYPINVGGRPLHSWPAFVPVTFELAVLGGALAAVGAVLALNGLPRLHHPVFGAPGFDGVTRDRFLLVVEAADPKFELAQTRALMEETGATAVHEVPP